MSLKKVTLRNFRTCHDVELTDLEHLTVLMGRNGVGKTNILQGIEWLARAASTPKVSLYDDPSGLDKNFFGQIVFSLSGVNYRYTLLVLIQPTVTELGLQESLERQDENTIWKTILRRNGEKITGVNGEPLIVINEAMPMLPAIIALKPSSQTEEDILSVQKYLLKIKYYSFDERFGVAEIANIYFKNNIVSHNDYREWLAKSSVSLARSDSIIMRILHMYFDRPDDFVEMKEIFGPNGLGILNAIDIVPLTSPTSGQTKGLTPSPQDHKNSYFSIDFIPGNGWEGAEFLPRLPYHKLSAGTRRILRILVSFFYDRNSLFLFEQPEDAIHPGLLRKLIGLLRSYDDRGQLIMASHSSDLFDVLKPEEVRLVTMQGGETKVRGLTESELASAKRFINEEGSLLDYLDLLETD